MRPIAALSLSALALVAACGRGPSLETRTFELRYLDGGQAEQLIKPYVFADRTGAPGELSTTRGMVSVRETRDNLERIERMLAEYDRAPAMVRLTFQIIRANGPGPADSSIADVTDELRRLFRFRGYRLAAQGSTTGGDGSPVVLRLEGPGGPYVLAGFIQGVATGDSGSVRLRIGLSANNQPVIETEVRAGIGRTVVLGGQQGDGAGAIILAVRSEVTH